ncbi:molybdopterin-guanine dinucleotide biosynthesis protein B [Roseiarcaceae bacterium H3SJ34-1]|uniref:molybdopterin-guanine dinucleotide biosynthesis protein B n=1 Tax=Terripilifer ovatus TaxID=3032367 RepID=UPI003AB95323|nr:molybdopterin-guanine dinucleotide biosynthesis protein B [Roseiarcaceae bacterium H3SJ34-1]
MKIIGLAGWSGAGKTTLLNKLIPHLIGVGVSVSTIKHAHHGFDVDIPGKDSWQHRQAGATEVLVASGKRWALMRELRGESEWSLPDLLDKLTPVDLVIVEGFKRSGHPKIEVHRAENGKPYLWPDDRDILGIAGDAPTGSGAPPCVALDAIGAVADMMLAAALPIDTVRARLAQRAKNPE